MVQAGSLRPKSPEWKKRNKVKARERKAILLKQLEEAIKKASVGITIFALFIFFGCTRVNPILKDQPIVETPEETPVVEEISTTVEAPVATETPIVVETPVATETQNAEIETPAAIEEVNTPEETPAETPAQETTSQEETQPPTEETVDEQEV